MSKRDRRQRSDSAAAHVSAVRAAAEGVIEPPAYVDVPDEARPFWDAIMLTRAADSWTPGDLVLASHLARINAEIDDYLTQARENGRVAEGPMGAGPSPEHKVLKDLHAQSLSLSRSLQVHARATQGESRDQRKRNDLHQHANEVMNDQDDGLIARPMH